MKTRAAELRQRDRRILIWSLSIAVVFHIALFLFWPTMEVEPLPTPPAQVQAGSSKGTERSRESPQTESSKLTGFSTFPPDARRSAKKVGHPHKDAFGSESGPRDTQIFRRSRTVRAMNVRTR